MQHIKDTFVSSINFGTGIQRRNICQSNRISEKFLKAIDKSTSALDCTNHAAPLSNQPLCSHEYFKEKKQSISLGCALILSRRTKKCQHTLSGQCDVQGWWIFTSEDGVGKARSSPAPLSVKPFFQQRVPLLTRDRKPVRMEYPV